MKITRKTDYTTTDLVAQTLAESQLRISAGYDSANVLTKLDAARQLVELDTNRSILNTVWTMKLDKFPPVIYLPKGVVQSVDAVKYLDVNDSEQTLTLNTDYYAYTGFEDGRIEPVSSWPTTSSKKNAVQIEFTTGYGASPSQDTSWAETAILLKLEELYYSDCDNSQPYQMIVNSNRMHSISWMKNG